MTRSTLFEVFSNSYFRSVYLVGLASTTASILYIRLLRTLDDRVMLIQSYKLKQMVMIDSVMILPILIDLIILIMFIDNFH